MTLNPIELPHPIQEPHSDYRSFGADLTAEAEFQKQAQLWAMTASALQVQGCDVKVIYIFQNPRLVKITFDGDAETALVNVYRAWNGLGLLLAEFWNDSNPNIVAHTKKYGIQFVLERREPILNYSVSFVNHKPVITIH